MRREHCLGRDMLVPIIALAEQIQAIGVKDYWNVESFLQNDPIDKAARTI